MNGSSVGSVGHRGSFWHLLTEATPVAPLLLKPCRANPVHDILVCSCTTSELKELAYMVKLALRAFYTMCLDTMHVLVFDDVRECCFIFCCSVWSFQAYGIVA